MLYGLWRFYRARAELRTTRKIGEQLLTLAQNQDNPTILLAAHVALGTALYFMGAFRLPRMHLEQGIAEHTPRAIGAVFELPLFLLVVILAAFAGKLIGSGVVGYYTLGIGLR